MNRIRRALAAAAIAAATCLTLPAAATAATPGPAAEAAVAYTAKAAAMCPQETMFGGLIGQKTYGPGQYCLAVMSSNSEKVFVFQGDGNLVFYRDNRPLWASNTNGRGSVLALQGDGNMVIYDAAGRPVWATMTVGIGITTRRLVVQTDGNVVAYKYPYQGKGQTAVWATGTNGRY